MAFVGQYAESAARQFYADLFFFSSSSPSEDGAITDYSEEEVALRKAMLGHSRASVLLCNSAKIGTVSAFSVATLSEIDYLVTDAPLPFAMMERNHLTLLKEQDGAYLYQSK